jgi:cation diffusion facilitator family transporter
MSMGNLQDRDLDAWQHDHDYLSDKHERNEHQTRLVIALTAVMMVVEIVAGTTFNSMALLADGWHMASHASALSITAFAYWFARRHRSSARFSFGTWKVGVLGGFTSAVVLGIVAVFIASESVLRFVDPRDISFDQAIAVAVIGLTVNVISAWLLRGEHHHGHHHDHNLRAAYLHVLADALTSLAAIFALFSGRILGWSWMDPLMGIVGSLVIGRWAYGLVRETAALLLDANVESDVVDTLRSALQRDSADFVSDLHVWHVGPGQLAAIAVIVTDAPRSPAEYKALMQSAVDLAHATVEVNRPSGSTGTSVCAA